MLVSCQKVKYGIQQTYFEGGIRAGVDGPQVICNDWPQNKVSKTFNTTNKRYRKFKINCKNVYKHRGIKDFL
jgi:hypothetical protein